MAPTFLQKLAKATSPSNQQTRDRIASDSSVRSSGRLSIGRNRSPSVSIKSTSGSTASNTTTTPSKQDIGDQSNDIPSINILSSPTDGHVVEHQGSFDTVSSQPNVTIIPPSPLVGTKDLDSDTEDQGPAHDANIPPVATGVQPVPPSQSRTTGAAPKTTTQPQPEELHKMVTSTPTQTIHIPIDSPISPAPTITPTQRTIPDKENNKMVTSNSVLMPSPLLREQASNKSLKSAKKTPPLDLQISPPPLPVHPRSSTAPAGATFPSPNGDATMMDAIAESPTELRPSLIKSDSQNTAESTSIAMELSSSPKGLGVLQPEQTGSLLSLSSVSGQPTDEKKQSRRPWRRSTTRKPTGLASAIAASGLAIAHPSLSPSHSAQAAAQISPPISITSSSGQKSKASGKNVNGSPGSPPYLSKSPAQSAISNRSWQEKGKNLNADLSPRSGKSGRSDTARQGRIRRPSRGASDAGVSEYGSFVNGKAPSMNGDESFTRHDYYSGLELDADSSSDDMSGSDISGGVDEYIGDDRLPVTGFAVASTKRNQDFHEMFPTVPEGDYLIEDYGCALQREILIQGRLYISENHICFHANIFGWITDLSIPVYEITALEKKMTAFVIPNAIQIATRQGKSTFTSFLSRDTTFDVMHNIWRLARPEDSVSMMSSGRASTDGAPVSMSGENIAARLPVAVAATKVAAAKKATMCACGKDGKHYSETTMDTIIPGTPEKINNMLFASGFIKEFLSENQKVLDIQMSDWAPVSPGSNLLVQNLTYIKPLAGSLGPKQTKCEIKHEMVYCDFDEFVSTVTTTRTPDVPSGGVFAVKTRTCVMWASPVSSRVIITSQVEWSGRSFIKVIIEKSAIDGQKQHVLDLEKAMRTYIQEHQTEFLPEGVEAAAIPDIDGQPPSTGVAPDEEKHPTPEELKQRERERNARGLQWAWDTFDGAYQVGKRSAKGALELIRDAWDQSSSTTILWFVIVILVLSNLWTLIRMGSNKAEAARKLEARKVEEREKWVQSIVTALWEELAAGKDGSPMILQSPHATTSSQVAASPTIVEPLVLATEMPVLPMRGLEHLKEEVAQLRLTLQALEGRVLVIKDSLAEYETGLNALD